MNQQEARTRGIANGLAAAENCEVCQEDKREAACPCNPGDPIEFCEECLGYAAHDAEQNARQYAGHLPEFDRDDDETRYDGLWNAYNVGVATGIHRGMKPRLKALAKRRREAADGIKALLHPETAPGDWGALTISPLEAVLHLVSAAANDDITNETWQTVFVGFGHAAGLAQEAAEVLTGRASEWDKVVGAMNRMGVTQAVKALGDVFGWEAVREAIRGNFGPDFLDSTGPRFVVDEKFNLLGVETGRVPPRIEEGLRLMQEHLVAEALDAGVSRVVVVGQPPPEDKYIVFGRDTDARPDDSGAGFFKFVETEVQARSLFLGMAPRYNVRHYMAPAKPEEPGSLARHAWMYRPRVTLGVRVGRGAYTLWLRLASEDAAEFDYLWEGPDPDHPEVTRGVLALDEYGFGGRLGNYAVFKTLEFIEGQGFHVPGEFAAQAAMAAGVQPDKRVRELIRAAAEEDPGEDEEDEVLRRAQRPSVRAGQRYDAIQGYDHKDRTAEKLARANFDPADKYHENIKHGAREMVARGLGDAAYQTQYESGSTVWTHPLTPDTPYTVTAPGLVVEEVRAQAHECYMGDGYCDECRPEEPKAHDDLAESGNCPDCPHELDDHDNATGCQAEVSPGVPCDCYRKRGYDL